MIERLLVVIFLVPIGVGIIALGGPAYTLLIALILGAAAWEYWNIFNTSGFKPSLFLLIGGVLVFVLSRSRFEFTGSDILLSLVVLTAMIYHLYHYEKGRDLAATDFGITLSGILYLGWVGSYFVSLRNLPEGKWLILIVLPSIWFADSAAMFTGTRWGKHKLAPRLSPHKTWEGYLGGILGGAAGGLVMTALWQLASPGLSPWRGALLGLILAIITPLGDLGESMIKRQAGFKDSSHIIPGHGGVMDRIDSWIWGAVIGYYIILWLW